MALFDHSALFTYLTLALREDSALLSRLYQFGNPHVEQLDRRGQGRARRELRRAAHHALVLALAEEVKRTARASW
jgi:hypothetical protein